MKRVVGADPELDLNVSGIRDLPDAQLLRLALQAVLGNLTAGTGPSWQQPCSIVRAPPCRIRAGDRPDTEPTRCWSRRRASWWPSRVWAPWTWACVSSC